MARLARLSIAGLPHHLLQRGNNRQPIFLLPSEREFFLQLLAAYAAQHGVAVHAYVLLPDHFHLVATPHADGALSGLMQSLGRSYVRHFNDAHGRTGTLWDGRYRSSVLQAHTLLLPCMAYLDLHPVRTGLVAHPAEYAWSSYGHYAGLRVDALLTTPDSVWQLGNTPFARESGYRQLVDNGVAADKQHALTQSVLHGWALGDPEFVAQLQRVTTRRLSPSARGRPVIAR